MLATEPLSKFRECGECSLCCKVVEIEETESPRNEWCKHCDPGKAGCTIHSERPDSCRNCDCLWLQGMFDDEHKPDKTGVVFFLWDASAIAHLCLETNGKLIVGYPDGEVLERQEAINQIGRIAQHNLVMLADIGIWTLFGPDHLAREAEPILQKIANKRGVGFLWLNLSKQSV